MSRNKPWTLTDEQTFAMHEWQVWQTSKEKAHRLGWDQPDKRAHWEGMQRESEDYCVFLVAKHALEMERLAEYVEEVLNDASYRRILTRLHIMENAIEWFMEKIPKSILIKPKENEDGSTETGH